MHPKTDEFMNRVSTYIRQSLCDIYPPQELKSLTMMIWCDLLGMDALDIYYQKANCMNLKTFCNVCGKTSRYNIFVGLQIFSAALFMLRPVC